ARVVSDERPRSEAPVPGHRPRRERSLELPPAPRRGRRMIVSAVSVAVSALWLAVLAFTNVRDTSGGLIVTAALIGITLVVSLYVLCSRNHILLFLNGLQLGLFAFINYQLFAALGPEHFTFDTAPQTWDWIAYTGSHVIHVADVLDFLEEYGIDLQNLKHQSAAASIVLVALHFTIAIFLIAFLMKFISAVIRHALKALRLTSDGKKKGGGLGGALLLLFLLMIALIVPMFLLGRRTGNTGQPHVVLGIAAAAVMLLWVALFFFGVLRMLVRLSGLGQNPAARVARRRRVRAGRRGLRALAFVGLAGTLTGIFFYAKNHNWPTPHSLLCPVHTLLP